MVVHSSSVMRRYSCVLVESVSTRFCYCLLSVFRLCSNISQISPSAAFQEGHSTMLQTVLVLNKTVEGMSLKWLNWWVVWRGGVWSWWLMWFAFINIPNGLFYEQQWFILLFFCSFLETDWFWKIETIMLWDTNEEAVKNLIWKSKGKRSLVNKILFHIVKR